MMKEEVHPEGGHSFLRGGSNLTKSTGRVEHERT